jgi:hypothetical protein
VWWDLVTFQTFIVIANGKVSKVKNFCMNIMTTKSKWFVNILLILLFINPRFEKHLSSSTLPITMAIDNSISFNHQIADGKKLVVGQGGPNFCA